MKAKKKKSASKKNLLIRYNEMKAQQNVKYTAMKTAVDLVLGVLLGSAVGAASGKASLPIGVAMLAGGQYTGEESGIVRIAGAASIAYGIGKSRNSDQMHKNNMNPDLPMSEKLKSRLTSFKGDVFEAFYLDKLMKNSEQELAIENQSEVGAIDLSSLDIHEEALVMEAENFQNSQGIEDFEEETELDLSFI